MEEQQKRTFYRLVVCSGHKEVLIQRSTVMHYLSYNYYETKKITQTILKLRKPKYILINIVIFWWNTSVKAIVIKFEKYLSYTFHHYTFFLHDISSWNWNFYNFLTYVTNLGCHLLFRMNFWYQSVNKLYLYGDHYLFIHYYTEVRKT